MVCRSTCIGVSESRPELCKGLRSCLRPSLTAVLQPSAHGSLGIVLVGPGGSRSRLEHRPPYTSQRSRQNGLRSRRRISDSRSSASMLAESAVEPTKSLNMTVTWRRSAASQEEVSTAAGPGAAVGLALASARRAAIVSRSFRRCPMVVTSSSFKSSAVKFERTVSSMSFSRNAPSYLSRPRLPVFER
jgi:hypothetical protein